MKNQTNQRRWRCSNLKLFVTTLLIAGGVATSAFSQVLTHRYSFSEPPGSSDVPDSVGTMNGTLVGTGSFDGNGSLNLAGVDGYVDLGPDLITGYSSVTFESWVSFGTNPDWARLLDFGDTDLFTGRGAYGMDVMPHAGGGRALFEVFDTNPGFDHALGISSSPQLDNRGKIHLVAVYDPQVPIMALYVNGAVAAMSTNITIPFSAFTNTHSYLGRSGYNNDPYLNATLDEFRIYSGALSPFQIAINGGAGPSNLVADPGVLTNINLTAPASVYAGQTLLQAQVTGDYKNVKGVNLSFGAPTLVSGNPNILSIGTNLQFDAKQVGTTTLIASYGGLSATQTVTVTDMPAILTHQYQFNEVASSTSFADSVGGANGFFGGSASLDGSGHLVLPGGASGANYAEMPAHLIDGYTALTFEFWVNFGSNPTWGRLVDFGDTNPDNNLGRYCIDFTPNAGNVSGVNFEVSEASTQAVNPGPPLNGWSGHLVLVYNPLGHSMSIYTNGVLMGRNPNITIPLSALVNAHSWLGRSSYINDSCGVATIDEFRIYNGVLSDLRVAMNAVSGPTNYINDTGSLTNLHLAVSSPIYVGQTVGVGVTGDYVNIQGLSLAFANPTLQSGNTNVIKVGSGMTVNAVGIGTTTLVASYGGYSVTQAVTVIEVPSVIMHRYSFNETGNSTSFADSVGTANGNLFGTASLDGSGHLVLPGGAGGANYAELPGHLIDGYSALTFEFWLTFGNNPTWGRLVDFGDTNPDSNWGRYCLDFTPNSGDVSGINFEVSDADPGFNHTQLVHPGPPLNGWTGHLVLVYAPQGNYMSVYTNGVLMEKNAGVTIPMSALVNAHSWLGKSSYVNDNCGIATIDELRIYNGALGARQIAADFASGPNTLPAPNLTIQRESANLVFTWPDYVTAGYTLQTSPSLAPATWVPVSGNIVATNGAYQCTAPTGAKAAFYRLIK